MHNFKMGFGCIVSSSDILFLHQNKYICLFRGLYLEIDNPIQCNAHVIAVYCIALYCMFFPVLQSDYFLWNH